MKKRATTMYPLEFKESSAKLAAESSKPISQTAKDLGINMTTLHGWVKKFHPNQPINSVEKNNLHEENKQLRAENIRLKQERDILKKAAAYFAREM
jgi:transposase